MNALTVTFLLVCVGAAYASTLPANPAPAETPAVLGAQPAEELLQGEEARWRGGGYNRGGGYHGGGYHGYPRGGGYHGYPRGGGYHGYHRGGGRGWRK